MPIILQHCFGTPGSGGPATALERMLKSSGRSYPVLWQDRPAGGVSLSLLRDFVRRIREVDPDLIHIRGLGNEGFHAAVAARRAGVRKVLVSIHGTQRDLVAPASRLRSAVVARILEPVTLRLADHIVTVCDFAAERDFLRPHRRKLLAPVPNGVPLPTVDPETRQRIRSELGIDPERMTLISVSRLSVEKGVGDLAQALAALSPSARPLDVIILGDGPDRPDLKEKFSRQSGITAHFTGFRKNVGDYLQAADLFVFPSWHENLSNALLEAMSFSLPVLATAVGGNVEVLRKGGGVLVPAQNPEAMMAALLPLLASAERRAALGAEARRVIEAHYSIDRMINGWEQTYDAILAGKPA